jgi:hypothetical protein
VSAILLNITTDDEGAKLSRQLELSDQRIAVIELGSGSRKFEIVITDSDIIPGSGQGQTVLRSLLDVLDANWQEHIVLADENEGSAG